MILRNHRYISVRESALGRAALADQGPVRTPRSRMLGLGANEGERGKRARKGRERERKRGEPTEKTTWVRGAAEDRRPTLLARRIARLPRRIPAPTVLLRAKWLIIIIIILYFLRFSGAPKPPKSKKPAKLI